jgi:hypothetical protein
MLIPEAEARKDDIDLANSAPVVLADGQTWYLPKPWYVIRPSFADGRMVGCDRLTYGPDLDPLVRRIRAEEDPFLLTYEIMSLGAFLLRRNYDLTDGEIEPLFEYRVGDPASRDMRAAILDVAEGVGPKA